MSAGHAASPSSRAMFATITSICAASCRSGSCTASRSAARIVSFSASPMTSWSLARACQRRLIAFLRQSTASSRSAGASCGGGAAYRCINADA
eukprot:5122381-Prymnesium_polylepis.1